MPVKITPQELTTSSYTDNNSAPSAASSNKQKLNLVACTTTTGNSCGSTTAHRSNPHTAHQKKSTMIPPATSSPSAVRKDTVIADGMMDHRLPKLESLVLSTSSPSQTADAAAAATAAILEFASTSSEDMGDICSKKNPPAVTKKPALSIRRGGVRLLPHQQQPSPLGDVAAAAPKIDTSSSSNSVSDYDPKEKKKCPFLETDSQKKSASLVMEWKKKPRQEQDSKSDVETERKEAETSNVSSQKVGFGEITSPSSSELLLRKKKFSPTSKTPLKPALRSSPRFATASGGSTPPTTVNTQRKRVHGLWSNERKGSPFAKLHDELLLHLFSSEYLGMEDIVRCQCVSPRFRSLASHEKVWRNVDATDFVRRSFDFHQHRAADPVEATTEALVTNLRSHAPVSLTVKCIEHRLSAVSLQLPSMKRMQSLTLTGFADLSDAHVHVMLLSALPVPGGGSSSKAINRRRRSSFASNLPLKVLKLDQCPNLTDACLVHIARHCPNLQELSLRGCRNITELSALQDLWKRRQRRSPVKQSTERAEAGVVSASLHAASERDAATAADLSSLHAPPSPSQSKTSGLTSLFAPPSPAKSNTSDLTSLFAPPSPAKSNTSDLTALFTPPPTKSDNKAGLTSLFAPPSATPAPPPPKSNAADLTSLFAPPPPPKKTADLASLFSLQPATPKSSGGKTANAATTPNGLSSLFAPAPPPMTEARKSGGTTTTTPSVFPSSATPSISLRKQQPMNNSHQSMCRIDLSNTGVTADSFLRSLQMVTGNNIPAHNPPNNDEDNSMIRLHLESITMRGCGESFSDHHLLQLADEILLDGALLCLDIGCANQYVHHGGKVTDVGLEKILVHHPKLSKLGLAGHHSVSFDSLTVSSDLVVEGP